MTAQSPAAAEPMRDRLLAAALDEFVAHGYERTHLRTIAARAGCTTGAIYGQFGSKAALLAEALGRELARAVETLSRVREERPGAAPLRDTTLAILANPPADLYALLVDVFSASRTDPLVAELARERLRGMADRYRATVVARQSAGEVDPALEPDAVRDVSMALVLGAIVLQAMGHPTAGRDGLRAVLDRVARALEP